MSAYKQFNTQDLIVSPLEVNKGFRILGGGALTASDIGIGRFLGKNGNYLISGSTLTGTISGQQIPEVLVYDSIKHLYYSNYISGSRGFSGNTATSSILLGADETGNTLVLGGPLTNYYNYEPTTLWPNRIFSMPISHILPYPTAIVGPPSSVGVISIPSKLFGDYIQPNSFLIETFISGSIKDDGEGRLLWNHKSGTGTQLSDEFEIAAGNIIYEHGIITLFDSFTSNEVSSSVYGGGTYGTSSYGGKISERLDSILTFITGSNITMSFSSSYKIFETQYQCTINENEFNYSLNPSSITGSQISTKFSGSIIYNENTSSIGKPKDFVTSSYFNPYITTVGLYSKDYELLAVGKLGKPIQSSPTTDTTILVNIDR